MINALDGDCYVCVEFQQLDDEDDMDLIKISRATLGISRNSCVRLYASPPREEECEAAWCARIVLLANGSLLGEKRLRKSCVFRAFQCNNVTIDAQL